MLTCWAGLRESGMDGCIALRGSIEPGGSTSRLANRRAKLALVTASVPCACAQTNFVSGGAKCAFQFFGEEPFLVECNRHAEAARHLVGLNECHGPCQHRARSVPQLGANA